MIDEPRGAFTYRSSTLVGLADFGPFHGVLLTDLGSRSDFLWLLNPKMRLRVIHQHSPFCPILARFMGYYSPFWGSCAISLLVELQGPITCRSSTLAVLADSTRLMGYCSPF